MVEDHLCRIPYFVMKKLNSWFCQWIFPIRTYPNYVLYCENVQWSIRICHENGGVATNYNDEPLAINEFDYQRCNTFVATFVHRPLFWDPAKWGKEKKCWDSYGDRRETGKKAETQGLHDHKTPPKATHAPA